MNDLELNSLRLGRRAATMIIEIAPDPKKDETLELYLGCLSRVIWIHENQLPFCHVVEKDGVAMIDDDQAETLFKLSQP